MATLLGDESSPGHSRVDNVDLMDYSKLTKQGVYDLIQSSPARVSYVINGKPHIKSEVWKKFKIVYVDGNRFDYVKCNSCIAIFQWFSHQGTSSIARHKCNIPVGMSSECPPNQLRLTSMVPKTVPSVEIDILNDKLATGLALDLRPMSSVDGRGFKQTAQALINFGAKYGPHKIETVIKSRKTLKDNHLQKVVDTLKGSVLECVRSSPSVPMYSFTFDLWTEPKRNRPFISLTTHYADHQLVLKSHLLGANELPAEEQKTTENVRRACSKILSEYFADPDGLFNDCYAVTDGGSNMISVFNHRLPCMCHKLNLILERTFSASSLNSHPSVSSLFVQAKQLVTYFKHAGLNGSLPTSLKQTVPTRWNSNLSMLESIIASFADVQRILLAKDELHRIAGFNKTLAMDLIQVLKPFQRATEIFSAEKTVTLDKIVPQFCILDRHLNASDQDSGEISRIKDDLRKWFRYYYEASLEPIHYAAAALNPS